MIRINLKKRGSSSQAPGLGKFDFKDLKNLKLAKPKINNGMLILAGVFLALAALPHVLFLKYQEHVESVHKASMDSMASESETIKSETNKYETYKAEMKSIEEQDSRINQRLNVVKKLQASRVGPVNVLDALGQALPQRVWLNNVDLSFLPSNQIQISGRGYSSEDVAEFVEKLSSSIYFEKVNLESVASEKDEQSGTVKTFSMSAVPKLNGAADRTVANNPKIQK